MYRAVAFVYCLVCHMSQVCTSESDFNFVSISQRAFKSTPLDCEAEWRGAACMACVYSTLLTSTNSYRILRTAQPKKRFFYLFSRSPWTVMDSDRLQRASRFYRPKLRCLFTDCQNTLRPQSMPLPKTVPISVCAFHSVSTARFANISVTSLSYLSQESKGVTTWKFEPR